MRKKLKNTARFIVVCIVFTTFIKCQKDDDVGQSHEKTILSAKEWFKNYEAEGSNYVLFNNLDYNWNDAEITKSEDGTKTVIVPINENKKDPTENWEQKLYIYQLADNNYQTLLIEIYPDSSNIDVSSSQIDSGFFNGYISVSDLKKGALKVAKFENGKLIENGVINVSSKGKTLTNKAPGMAPCPAGTFCEDEGASGGTELKEVVVNNNYQNPGTGYVIQYNPTSGGGNIPDTGTGTGTYTNPGSGSDVVNSTGTTTTNPCDDIKAQLAIANIKAKIDELKKKTNLKVESGYSQSKNGPFTALSPGAGTASTDTMILTSDPNTIGYLHTHLDPYDRIKANGDIEPVEPIRMFSPEDVNQFLILVVNAQRNNIPINNVYGTMISSTGTYQLRFTGNVSYINAKNSSINWGGLKPIYIKYMKGNKELGFLKFLDEQIGINGIELYKIDTSKNSRKLLNNSGKVTTINCN